MDGLFGPLLVAVLVLAVAGAAKLHQPQPTAAALGALPLPLNGARAVVSARLLGGMEVVVAIWTALTLATPALYIVAGLYTVFAIFVVLSLGGAISAASCGCFGGHDSPPTIGHLVFNAVAASLAFVAAGQNPAWANVDLDFGGFLLLAAASLTGAALSVLAMSVLPAVLALANGTAVPVRTFEIDPHLRSQVNP